VDGRISPSLEAGFKDRGIQLIKTEAIRDFTRPFPFIRCRFSSFGERKIVYAPGVPKKILRELSEWGFLLLKGEAELGPKYPASVYYNAARVGNIVFHNTKYTDKILRENFSKMGIELVHINQGTQNVQYPL